MKKILLIALISVCVTGIGSAQYSKDISKRGGTAAPFLSIGMGARATSMGSAFVALADDPSAIYWNPAGLAGLDGIQVTFDHTRWLADVNYNFIAFSYNMGDMGTIAFSYTTSDYGDMEVTTVDFPDGNGQIFSATDAVVSVGYGLYLTDRFSIGFNPKLIYQSIWNTSTTGLAIDVGVKYITPFDDAVLAMSITNFGTEMKLNGRSTLIIYDPDPDNSGNNGKIPSNYSTEGYPLPLTFKMGLSWTAIKSDVHSLTIAGEAAHPSDDYESINLGGEYAFSDFLFLRGGYNSLFLADKEQGLTLGAGIRQLVTGNFKVQLDYAFADYGRLNSIQKVTLSMLF